MKPLIIVILLFTFSLGLSQEYDDPIYHGNEYGGGVTIAMSGFGFGGFYRWALPNYSHIGVNANFYVMRDDNQFTYYDPYYTYYPIEVNNYNRLFIIPIAFEYKKRFFTNTVADGTRPYFIASSGFTFGMNFPRDPNEIFTTTSEAELAGYPTENEYQFTYNATVGFGVDITTQKDFYISLRPQYRFMRFTKSIAGKKDHSNFEILIEIGKRSIR